MKPEIDILNEAVSAQRLKKYISLYDGDMAKVVAHYKANLALRVIGTGTLILLSSEFVRSII